MLVGYMRVSSEHDRQTTDLQHDALIDAGVDPRHLFADKASGARDDRPGLQHALAYVRPAIVWLCGNWTGLAGLCLIFSIL